MYWFLCLSILANVKVLFILVWSDVSRHFVQSSTLLPQHTITMLFYIRALLCEKILRSTRQHLDRNR